MKVIYIDDDEYYTEIEFYVLEYLLGVFVPEKKTSSTNRSKVDSRET